MLNQFRRSDVIANAARYRLAARNKPACDWRDHHWIKFVDPVIATTTILILCGHCGRDPAEALGELPVI